MTILLKAKDSFINEIINDEKGINNEILNEYFGYQNPSFLAKDLTKTDRSKYKQIVKQTVGSVNNFRSSIIKK